MPKSFERILFEIVIVLAVGVFMFMGLAMYDMHVIERQQDLIRRMQTSPNCMAAPGGNHG